jgi:predicted MPP superfamily phosphohydrolase
MTRISRRDFFKFSGLAAAGAVTATSAFLGINNESNQPVAEHIQIPIKGLAPGLEGFKIVQLSDIHLLPYTQPDLVRRSVEIANSLNPDLTVLTGDYVWRNLEAIFELTPILSQLNARHGVFAIIGNHDIWLDVDVVKSAFAEIRIPVLENQGFPITEGGGTLYIAGLDDGWSGTPDLNAALEGAPAATPTVLLLHEPDLADKYSQVGNIVLQLSGHSHGGQVRVPGFGAFILPYLGQKYDFGLYKVRDMWLYTNRGIGNISVPFRYNCAPEISEFTLISG